MKKEGPIKLYDSIPLAKPQMALSYLSRIGNATRHRIKHHTTPPFFSIVTKNVHKYKVISTKKDKGFIGYLSCPLCGSHNLRLFFVQGMLICKRCLRAENIERTREEDNWKGNAELELFKSIRLYYEILEYKEEYPELYRKVILAIIQSLIRLDARAISYKNYLKVKRLYTRNSKKKKKEKKYEYNE